MKNGKIKLAAENTPWSSVCLSLSFSKCVLIAVHALMGKGGGVGGVSSYVSTSLVETNICDTATTAQIHSFFLRF